MTNDYAERAAQAAESIDTKTSTAMTVGGIKALTYALLDVAAAIREHGRA
jgi:hypothetical protein